ncbi:MAG: PDZ domain-containing protein [Phycisphaerae bacterium]|nr:PDZ domain-containing protein [Phycisphaerae bacterium]
MLPIQTLLMVLSGLLWLPASAIDASAVPDEPILVKVSCDTEANEAKTGVVVRIEDADDDGGKRCIVKEISVGGDGVIAVAGDGGEGRSIIIKAASPDDDDDEASGTILKCDRLVIEGEGARDIKAGGPWLGIQFGPVPKPLAAHVGLGADVGQMVLNVVEGSPADDAGLAQYDVIVKIGGEDASSDMGAFLDRIRDLKPGETYAFTVIHGGKRAPVDLTVGERPEDATAAKHKYDDAAEEFLKGREFRWGGLLEKDDDGNWLFKRFDLGDMPDVWECFPDGRGLKFDFDLDFSDAFPQSRRNQFIWKDEKGSTIRIESGDDGEIKVTRTETEDGQETTTTKVYANEEELKKDDPEAHKMLHKASGGKISIFHGPDDKANIFLTRPGKLPGLHKFSVDDLDLDGILEGTEEARKHVEELREELRERLGSKGIGGASEDVFVRGKPRTSFQILSDGGIRVTRSRGGEELVESFKSAEELKAKRPDLYMKFERLHGGEGKNRPK